jgi:hypothetical protein
VGRLARLPLRFDAGVSHTLLDADLADPLDSDELTTLRAGLIAINANDRVPLVGGIGFQVRYTTADSFEGWALGLYFSP